MRFLPCLLIISSFSAFAAPEDHLADAYQAYQAKNQSALNRYAQALANTPVEAYTDYYQFSLALGKNNDQGIKTYLARSEPSPVINKLRGEWLEYLGEQKQWDQFQTEYKLISEPDNKLQCYNFQARWQNQDRTALNAARELWLVGKVMPNNCGTIFNSAIAEGIISQQDIWQRIRLLLESNQVTLSLSLTDKLQGRYWLSSTNLRKASKNPESYLKQLQTSNLNQLGERTIAAFALQRLAKQSPDIALQYWNKIEDVFPAEEQQYVYGWLAYEAARDHDSQQALRWYNKAGSAALNEDQIAWWTRAALRTQNWQQVYQVIRAMPTTMQEDETWRYWRAHALIQMGQKQEAMPILAKLSSEFNFYGQLAAEALSDTQIIQNQNKSYKPSEADIREMSQLPAVQRTITLYRADLRRDALREWAWFVRNFNDKQLLTAAEVANRYQMYDRAIGAASLTNDTHDFSLRFLAPYRHALQPHIREFNLEEAWVYGLMRQESRFAVTVRSHVGARGLMQIMPDTGKWIAKKLGISGFSTSMLDDMDTNMRMGTYYMRNVSNQFDDNPVLVSAAYNAGPGRARRWRDNQPLDGAIYAETIPFNETRDYVKKVMSNTLYYADIFNTPNPPISKRVGIIPSK